MTRKCDVQDIRRLWPRISENTQEVQVEQLCRIAMLPQRDQMIITLISLLALQRAARKAMGDEMYESILAAERVGRKFGAGDAGEKS